MQSILGNTVRCLEVWLCLLSKLAQAVMILTCNLTATHFDSQFGYWLSWHIWKSSLAPWCKCWIGTLQSFESLSIWSPIYSLWHHVLAAVISHPWNSAKLHMKLACFLHSCAWRSEDIRFAKSQEQVWATVLCSTSPTNKTVVAEPEGATQLIPEETKSIIFINYLCSELSVLGRLCHWVFGSQCVYTV
jgi:hypothetical protein